MALSAKGIKLRYRIFKEKKFIISFIISIALLTVSFFVNYYASIYAAERVSSPVTDIILSNIRLYDVDGIFTYGPLVLWAFVGLLFFAYPNKIPFTLKSIALFVVIRSAFVSMTHIGTFVTIPLVDPTLSIFSSFFSYGADLFFSGHTGLPFLLALIFWDSKPLRYLFVLSAIFFGIIVLMGHFHYTIDVFSAFFITYSIYHIALNFFPKDKVFFARHTVDE